MENNKLIAGPSLGAVVLAVVFCLFYIAGFSSAGRMLAMVVTPLSTPTPFFATPTPSPSFVVSSPVPVACPISTNTPAPTGTPATFPSATPTPTDSCYSITKSRCDGTNVVRETSVYDKNNNLLSKADEKDDCSLTYKICEVQEKGAVCVCYKKSQATTSYKSNCAIGDTINLGQVEYKLYNSITGESPSLKTIFSTNPDSPSNTCVIAGKGSAANGTPLFLGNLKLSDFYDKVLLEDMDNIEGGKFKFDIYFDNNTNSDEQRVVKCVLKEAGAGINEIKNFDKNATKLHKITVNATTTTVSESTDY